VIKEQLVRRLPKPAGGPNRVPTPAGPWETAIVDAVRAASAKYKFAWAKIPVKVLVDKAYEHRSPAPLPSVSAASLYLIPVVIAAARGQVRAERRKQGEGREVAAAHQVYPGLTRPAGAAALRLCFQLSP
jgi:hypothetical protein